MRVSSRAVIFLDGKLVTMFRRKIKDGVTNEYYVIPGGGQEGDESLEQNVIRELKEEMNVDIKVLGYLGKTENVDRQEHYFHCEIIKGVPTLGGEEFDRMTKENFYQPTMVSLDDLTNININGLEFVQKAQNKEYKKNES